MYGARSRALVPPLLVLCVLAWAACSEPLTGPDVFIQADWSDNGVTTAQALTPGDIALEDLGTLGGAFSDATGINEQGWVVGQSETASGEYHAFLWTREGGMRDLNNDPAWVFTRAEGVNNKGQVVGWGQIGVVYNGFVWSEATGMVNIGAPGTHTASWCYEVNDAGRVVGEARDLSGTTNAIVWDLKTGGVTILGPISVGQAGHALDINDATHVVGRSALSTAMYRAVLWRPGEPTANLGTLGGLQSAALGVNNVTYVVGWANDLSGRRRPFIWDVAMVDLGTVGGADGEAYEISEDNLIVGWSLNGAVQRRATLWTPSGDIVDLGTLGGAASEAHDVNSDGMIVGIAQLADLNRHAALWVIEKPEPPEPPAPTPPELLNEAKAEVVALVGQGVLNRGQGNSLIVKVDNALKKVGQGNTGPAVNMLEAFVNQVEAFMSSGLLTPEEGQGLIDLVQAAIEGLSAGAS
jgi:probable HAF family extracellular repeat protein